jgi:hypothetical protein
LISFPTPLYAQAGRSGIQAGASQASHNYIKKKKKNIEAKNPDGKKKVGSFPAERKKKIQNPYIRHHLYGMARFIKV